MKIDRLKRLPCITAKDMKELREKIELPDNAKPTNEEEWVLFWWHFAKKTLERGGGVCYSPIGVKSTYFTANPQHFYRPPLTKIHFIVSPNVKQSLEETLLHFLNEKGYDVYVIDFYCKPDRLIIDAKIKVPFNAIFEITIPCRELKESNPYELLKREFDKEWPHMEEFIKKEMAKVEKERKWEEML